MDHLVALSYTIAASSSIYQCLANMDTARLRKDVFARLWMLRKA